MAAMHDGFPRDEYTPFGLLANPFAVARSWSDGSGGVLRSSRDPLTVGFGWVYPWALGAEAGAELRIAVTGGGESDSADGEPDRAPVVSPHHSAALFEYAWDAAGYRWSASFVLVGADQLGVEVAAERAPERPLEQRAELSDAPSSPVEIDVALYGWHTPRDDARADALSSALADLSHGDDPTAPPGQVGSIDLGAPYGLHRLDIGARIPTQPEAGDSSGGRAASPRPTDGVTDASSPTHSTRVALRLPMPEGHMAGVVVRAILSRQHADRDDVLASARIDERVAAAIERARAEDDALWRGAACLTGDWPDSWRRGWVYDLETTRMCVFPAGGRFADVWPSWGVQWPRVVVAEGTLDMVRLAYFSPDLVQRAVLSLFRDAAAPNVPCVFQHGEPNMIAADGSVCGTSPAWCVPFYNVERLYLLTLDDGWLAELYPYLARYLDWWLAERTDKDGWAVYKCTWEAGEDDTPRLDPERRGDNVVSEYVRPVELQATMALSASVLARFADTLGRSVDATRWRSIASAYTERTRMLWDADAGRYRDWDARAGRFLEPTGEESYWDVDPCRFSALAFTPILAGIADRARLDALSREVELYDRPPWTLWPSWSYVVLESALAAGWRQLAARVAAGIVGRVYPELDRRAVAGNEPTPGVAREYWPLDLATWRSCEGYGWGATTASFLARQIFGFLEGSYDTAIRPTIGDWSAADVADSGGGEHGAPRVPPDMRSAPAEATPMQFRLAPGLPPDFLVPGRRYGLANLPYRCAFLDIEYEVERPGWRPDSPASSPSDGARLTASVRCRPSAGDGPSTDCVVADEGGAVVYASQTPSKVHRFPVRLGALYAVSLAEPRHADGPAPSSTRR